MKIPDPLVIHAQRRPRSTLVSTPSGEVSAEALDRYVEGLRLQLSRVGVGKGNAVAFVTGEDVFHSVLCFWALLRLGAVAVPLGNRLPENARTEILRRSVCRFVVGNGEFAIPSDSEWINAELVEAKRSGNVSFDLADRATIVQTSGSSGDPKLAVHSVANHFFSAWDSLQRIPLVEGHRWLMSIPLNHVGGISIVFRSIVAGTAIVISERQESMADAIQTTKATHVSLVDTQLRRLLTGDGVTGTGTLETVLCGGGPFPESLLENAIASGLPVRLTYGLTEASSQVCTSRVLRPGDSLSHCGESLAHVKIQIREGQIGIKGEQVFEGYLEEGGGLDSARDAEGWFWTGDLGVFEASGLQVTGRMDNMFISGGENVQPEEIEFFLTSIKGIERAVVVPIPDIEFGARPVALVEAREIKNLGVLREELLAALPGYKIPVRFIRFPDEYRNISKIDRRALREIALREVDS